ncbi:hypothetical protein V2J09_024323 [Rumex salicifolius]
MKSFSRMTEKKKTEEFDGNKVINQFEELTKNAERVQEEILKKILQDNKQAEYLRKLGLNGRTDPHSFKTCVPVVTHSDLETYIHRIVDGDSSSVLTGNPITVMSLSSGTSQGRPKFVPFNDELFDDTMQIYQTSYAFRNREFPIQNGMALQFIYSSKQFNTKGGLIAGTATTNVFRHPHYLERMKAIRSESCSPKEVIFGPDFHQSLYCHLLCGLLHRQHIQFVFSTFAHSIVHAFETFQQLWQELCTNIRTGVLSKRVTDSTIRATMSQMLKPDPELADAIHKICSGLENNWHAMVPLLFPNCKYVYGILTGSMEPYCKKLRHYAGSLPLVSADYGSSEGWIAANVHPKLPPESATFVVLPNVGYFEFIPLKEAVLCNGLEPKPVGLTEVEVGQEYEVVLTNFAGLYRYKLGDTVKVMGFHNSTPELKFMCRSNLLLTINIDKNTEKDLQLSVEEASKMLATEKAELVDFSSFVDRSVEPGHYVILWELTDEAKESVLRECANCLDRSFIDAGYVSSRKVGGIGALELRILKRGTFMKIQEHFLTLGTSMSQFKTPRCVNPNNKSVLQILYNNAVKSYFSSVYINRNAWSREKLSNAMDLDMGMITRAEEEEKGGEFSSEKVIEQFEAITKDAERVQREVLYKILEQNKEVEYLKKLGLNGKTDPETFKACVPLATYSDLRPYLDRIVAGEVAGVLTGNPVTTLSLSSGTSQGKPKICPFTEESMDAYVQSMITSYAYRSRAYPVDETKMSLQFLYISKKSQNQAGLVTGLISSHIISHPKFKSAFRPKRSSPDNVLWAPDSAQSLYCHLLLGLKNRHQIQYIFSVFAHTMVAAFQTLAQVWEELCHDIHHGSPSINRVTSETLRATVSAHLGLPDPNTAREIYEICDGLARKCWEGLVPSLFPNAKYVLGVMTGTSEHYVGRIKFFAGGLPLMGMDYGATEGWVATNIHPRLAPEMINFTVIPNIAYFEFIPLDEIRAEKNGVRAVLHPVGLTEVKVGQTYELVYTNFQGMYRYRLGDWVKITGFHNSTPMIKFLCRGDVMLSIHIDKTTEKDLQGAIEKATDHLTMEEIELIDYTSHADMSSGNEHYVIFWELSSLSKEDVHRDLVLQKCCNCLDMAIADLGYVTSRASKTIRPLELRVVRSGTFKKVLEFYMSSLEACNVVQFKMPRCVKNEDVLKIFKENVVKSYFSTASQ